LKVDKFILVVQGSDEEQRQARSVLEQSATLSL
jgi:hypothetical protein